MNAVQLDHQKVELAQQILSEDNAAIINKMIVYFNKVKKTTLTFPCQMTVDELKAEVEQSVIQYERGESKSHEEFFNEIKSW